jgi:hypothetical protein
LIEAKKTTGRADEPSLENVIERSLQKVIALPLSDRIFNAIQKSQTKQQGKYQLSFTTIFLIDDQHLFLFLG